MPESEQGELDLTASTQPEIKRGELRNIYGQPIDPLRNIEGNIAGPLTGPAKPIGEEIRGVVEAAKQDPSASKLLKANNPATAKLVTTRIEELVEAAGGDSVLAMEQLYENNRKGQGKALTPAQQELLDVAYRRATGRQIEDAIKERAFIGAAEPDLFEGDTTPAAPAPAPVVAANPETAWNEHKNDDHPAYTDLSPEEKAEWGRYVTKGTTGASAFQDVTRAYEERMVRDKKKTTEEVKQIFSEERKKTTKDIENDIAGLDYNGLLNYMLANGPESIQGVMRKVADAVKRMKAMGYTFSFDLSQSPQQSKLLNLGGNARSGAAGHVQPRGKHMQLVISGRNASRPFGGTFEIVAHELLHSVTIPLIRFGEANPNTPEGKIVQELKDLSAHVKKELRKRERMGTATPEELYYLNNTNAFGKYVRGWGTIHIADEIMSQGNTGSNFRYILETIPYKGKSALDAFVEMVRKLIGLSPKEETALSELIRLSDKLFEGQVSIPTSQYGKKVGSEVSTNSAAFKNWFGDSKVVDENGKPLVMYHSTTSEKDFNIFDTERDSYGGTGSFFSSEPYNQFIEGQERGRIIPAYLSLKNPAYETLPAGDKFNKNKLMAQGYDGVIFTSPIDGHIVSAVAFKPTQIKSAIGNIGTYSPDTGDIVSSERSIPWSERETPNQFGREEALTTLYKKTEESYFSTFSPDEAYDAVYDEATAGERSVLRQLQKENFLGFDYPHEAIEAILQEPESFELSSPLKAAISRIGNKTAEIATNKSSEFSMEDLPRRRENQDFVIKAGTNIYHGAHLDRAHGIDESGRILKARPGVKSGGGILTEGNLIWFGDKQLASGHAKSEVDTNAARYDEEAGIKRLPGKVFQATTDRDYKLISKGRVLSKEEADALNDALGIPDYKPLRAGDTADTAAYRAHTNSSTVPRYDISGKGTMSSPWPIILQTLGDYDGYYDSTGIALAAENAIELGGDNDTMRVSSERSVVDSQIPLDAQYDSQIGDIDTPAPAPGPTVVPAPGQPYTLPNLTKLQPAQTAGQQVKNVTKKVTNAWNDEGFWTRFRIAVVDQGSGLAKTLSSLPEFQNGQLRADMLIRSFNQIINLIKNGIQSGIPIVNADGTVIIRQDANNLARAQILADKLDSNPIVKGSGLSGRGYVAEITRIKRGEEIMAEDARLRAKGALMMADAKAKMAQARQLRASSAPMNEIIKLINQAKALRREGSKIKDINREKQVTQAHITWADAQINAVPETQEVFDIFRATNVGLIDLWESAGLLTKAEADNYRQKTFYVPLYAAREDLSFDDQESYTGKGTGTKTVRLLDRLEGSDLQRNIWENMDKHYASMTAAAFQNQTRRVAVEQLQTVGAAKISTTDDNPAVNLRYKDPSHPNANQHGVVSVILDNPNDLAAFQMMHYELGPLMKGLSATTQALRATALINPMYWIKQLIRDPIHAAIVARTGIVTPFHSAKEYINILANNSEEALLLARRGVIGQIDSTIGLADFLKQVGTEKLNPTKLDALIRKVMRMHEASDAATRVAIYKKAKAEGLSKGMSEAEATDYGVFKSRESINFAVRGNSKTLNTLRHMIPFFSAAITGLDTLYRAASGYGLNPEEKKAAQQLFIKRAGMMAMLSAAYAMILQDDEDYQKLPDNVKDNNWLLPNPFGGGHSFIKIAIPYEVGFLFKTVPEVSIRYMAGTSTGKEVLASYYGGLKRNLPGEGILIPQAAKPALEAITNYSFFTGRGIEGMSDQGLPTSQRGPNASEVAKTLSKAGLDKIGISPAKFDHLMQGYFAELGTFSTGMAGAAIAAATGKEPPAKNIEQMPFFKAFMTNPNTSKAATDFYEIMGTAQEVVNAVNRMKKEGRIQEAKEFLSDEDNRKLMAVAPAMRKVQDNMAKIRARVNQIEASKGMDPETKRVQINKLMELYDRTSRQGYAITEKAGISR